MTKQNIPDAVLEQHTAIVGKTGSGKTSTGKLAIEQVVAAGARVCILDPLKSDWWGLTSSADGKRPGLPFQILGGPRGHVQLHASAGKAIGEIVASGALPLSIIDMADFEPGGQARFFVDFAPTLIRRMRGVVYLVIEEAHLFAPKERSGVGAENLSIHWAKTLATAGRSKGIRLILLSQRTQALHNALLGSCDTMIAHRLSAPADQRPVLDWLKANASPGILEMVSAQLASLKTGAGWLCSGEAKIFQRFDFPRIQTYDNTATPTDDDHRHEVKMAVVDTEKLRGIVGDAVKDAEANDPKLLKAQLAKVQQELRNMQRAGESMQQTPDPAALETEFMRGQALGARAALADLPAALHCLQTNRDGINEVIAAVAAICDAKPAAPVSAARVTPTSRLAAPVAVLGSGPGEEMKPMPRAFLIALAQHPDGLSKAQILVHSGYRSSGSASTCFAEFVASGWATPDGNAGLKITPAGLAALGRFEPLPLGKELRDHIMNGQKCSVMEKAFLGVLFSRYPEAIAKGDLLKETGYASSGSASTSFARMVAIGYAEAAGLGHLRASEDLFRE